MSQPFIAEIRMFAGNFAPRGWAFCQGQIMSIAQNTALFSLLGTTYGGNGQTTFGLPDLRGRVPVGTGQGPGLGAINLGEIAGESAHTLISTEMPQHNHLVGATTNSGNIANPNGNVLSVGQVTVSGSTETVSGDVIGPGGGTLPSSAQRKPSTTPANGFNPISHRYASGMRLLG